MAEPSRTTTLRVEGGRRAPPGNVRRFRLTPLDRRSEAWLSSSDRCAIGSHALNDLVLNDPTVSRFHCEVRLGPEGARVRDLGSLNGTLVDGVPVAEAFLRGGSLIRLGNSTLRFDLSTGQNVLMLSQAARFGSLVGSSVPMRAAFALLERAAQSDATVLIEGETGTGKGQAAQAIHLASSHAPHKILVVDCAAIAPSLIESELFGHEKGAFTGADRARVGAFEAAGEGTIFLDEVGELPADVQPKLLRVLEERQFQRVGGNTTLRAEARVIAATNRDLRAEVNAGRFRSDLYFRLAVVKITLPPLSQRLEDMPALAAHLLEGLSADPARKARLHSPAFIAHLQEQAWPGNVRELRNYLERCLVLDTVLPVSEEPRQPEVALPWEEARERALEEFERRYVAALLAKHEGKVAAAARAAKMNPKYLYKLIRRYGLKNAR